MLTQEQIQSRLLNSQDPEIASVASEILVDKYMLTVENYRNSLTSTGTILVMFVPKSVMAYQSKRLDKMMRELSDTLAQAGDDVALQLQLLDRMNKLNRARSVINNKLGRV